MTWRCTPLRPASISVMPVEAARRTSGAVISGARLPMERAKGETMSESQPQPGPSKIAPKGRPANAAGIMTVFVTLVATLYFGKEVLIPVTLALMLAFILAPLVDLLERLHLGRIASVLLGVVLALGVALAIGGVIGTQVADLTTDLPKYSARDREEGGHDQDLYRRTAVAARGQSRRACSWGSSGKSAAKPAKPVAACARHAFAPVRLVTA